MIFCEPIRLYRAARGDVPEGHHRTPFGVARFGATGGDVTIVGWGAMMRDIDAAAASLEARGIGATTIDLRTLVPLDIDAVVDSVRETGRLVVVQEAPRTAGFASEVVAQVQERALYSLLAPIERVTGWDIVVPLRKAEHHYMPSERRIVAAVHRTLEG